MKDQIYKIAYSPAINFVLRNVFKPVYKLTKKRMISVSGTLRVKAANTSMMFETNQTCSATQELFYEGAEQYEFSKLFIPLIKNVNTFLDIGANIGYFSVLGAKINPNAKIYAFEPSVGPLHFLKKNIALNQLEKSVQVVGKAVSEIDGVLTFHSVVSRKYPWIEHNLNGSHSLQNNFGREKAHAYPVEVVSIGQFKKEQNISKIDLIKLDTECTEHLILQSALEVINEDRPIIISEIYEVIKLVKINW